MRARRTGARSRPTVLTAGGVASVALLLAACGGPAASTKADGDSAPGLTTASSAASPAAPEPGAGGSPSAAAAAAGKAAAARTSAQPKAASSAGAQPAGGGTTGAATGSSPQAASAQAPKAMAVNTKCRTEAKSVGNGVALKGQRPPNFSGVTLDCGSLDLDEYTHGKPTLVNFFASWCEPCHKEAKDLEAVYEEYHASKGFQIVGVETQDENGSPSWFYDKAHWTFPSVWDDKEKIEKAWNQASGAISTLPASFWIHPDGTISSIIIGEMSHSQMEDEFNKL